MEKLMVFETTNEIIKDVAKRFKKIRKSKNITQLQLSKSSNVSYGTIKRFETTGEISLNSLTKLCVALDMVDYIQDLFTNVSFNSIEEVIRYGKN
jgi:transcriptional regulator with XRE-family HTH domain